MHMVSLVILSAKTIRDWPGIESSDPSYSTVVHSFSCSFKHLSWTVSKITLWIQIITLKKQQAI